MVILGRKIDFFLKFWNVPSFIQSSTNLYSYRLFHTCQPKLGLKKGHHNSKISFEEWTKFSGATGDPLYFVHLTENFWSSLQHVFVKHRFFSYNRWHFFSYLSCPLTSHSILLKSVFHTFERLLKDFILCGYKKKLASFSKIHFFFTTSSYSNQKSVK